MPLLGTSTQRRCSSLARSATSRAGPRSLPTLAGSASCAASMTKPERARRRPFQPPQPPTTNGSGLVDSGSWASSPRAKAPIRKPASFSTGRLSSHVSWPHRPRSRESCARRHVWPSIKRASMRQGGSSKSCWRSSHFMHTMRRATHCWVQGEVARAKGDMEQARAHYQTDLTEAEASPSPRIQALALRGLADVAIAESDLSRAAALNARSLALRAQIEDSLGIANSLEGIAAAAIAADGHQRAARLLGAAQRLRARLGAAASPREERELSPIRTAIADKLGTDLAERELSAGQQLTTAEAIDLALGRS